MSQAVISTPPSQAPRPSLRLAPILCLLRKELHQSWSTLLLGCFIVAGFTAMGLQSRLIPDEMVVVLATLLVGGVIFPLLVAMGVVATERAEGSVNVLLRLPMPAWVVLGVKTIVALLVVFTPIALAAGVMMIIAGSREVEGQALTGLFLYAMVLAANMLLWTLCIGIHQPSEARVGMVGIGLIGLAFFVAAIVETVFTKHTLRPLMQWTLWGGLDALDRAGGANTTTLQLMLDSIWKQALVLLVLWVITAYRFGRVGRTRG